jgi:hypothetical protein
LIIAKQVHNLSRLSIQQLLNMRLCDLGLSIEKSVLQERVHKIQAELDQRGLAFRPYFWLSDDWFTPEGLTGVAIPFYLAHPRLVKLERNQMGEVEGGSREWFLKILRHEVGHAFDHAFDLHKQRHWQRLFGPTSRHYPTGYRPDPYSHRHVHNLEYWYAQAHPDEDFAETFAVWLRPRSQWRKRYQTWPQALEKLEYVDSLMKDLNGEKPRRTTRLRVDSLARLRKTVGQYYADKIAAQGRDFPDYYDGILRRHFTVAHRSPKPVSAASVLSRVRPSVMRQVDGLGGDQRHLFDQVLRDMAGRCRELRLFAKDPERQALPEYAVWLARHAFDSLRRNRRWVQM